MIEDILRAAQKANGMSDKSAKPQKNTSSYSLPVYGEMKWYEKKWAMALLMIFVCPLGLILLWSSERYSLKVKSVVTLAICCLVLVGHFDNYSTSKTSTYKTTSTVTSSSYDIGYLRGGSTWLDGNGNSHHNSNSMKVEIWGRKVETGNGKLTQIFFLEGTWAGTWGYTEDSFLSR